MWENLQILVVQPVFNLQLLLNGLSVGAVFALAAYGLALVWGVHPLGCELTFFDGAKFWGNYKPENLGEESQTFAHGGWLSLTYGTDGFAVHIQG